MTRRGAALVLFGALALLVAVTASLSVPSRHRSTPKPTTPATVAPATTVPPTTAPPQPVWRVAWGSAMAWAYQTVSSATVRSLVRVHVGGDAVEVRVSNRFGKSPLAVGAATVAVSAGGAALAPGAATVLTFAGSRGVTVPAGGSVTSDPAALATSPEQVLAVSVFVVGTASLTSHYPCCEASTPSFVSGPGSGDLTSDASGSVFGYRAPWSRLVDAVSVRRPASSPGSIVVLGDSISDGFNSTVRWPDLLQQRIDALPPGQRPAVIDEGNTANTLTALANSDAATGGGPPGLERWASDVASLPGVSTVVLFLGTNDLYFGASAAQVIAGMGHATTAAHEQGLRIVGVTLLPRRPGGEAWTPLQQRRLAEVNRWTLSTTAFDAVADLAPVVSDIYGGQCDPLALFPAYDSGDHLHLSAAGAAALANAFPLSVLGLPPLPPVPPVLATPRTSGCTPPQ